MPRWGPRTEMTGASNPAVKCGQNVSHHSVALIVARRRRVSVYRGRGGGGGTRAQSDCKHKAAGALQRAGADQRQQPELKTCFDPQRLLRLQGCWIRKIAELFVERCRSQMGCSLTC